MSPFRTLTWAALAMLASAGSAPAAWNNVFQVACNGCGQNTVANASPLVAVPTQAVVEAAPQQQCSTRYIQRSYYQPVTTYRPVTVSEPVTTYRTSYYYEPVTSYRYSSYYDPNTCGVQQVAQPVISYRLRSQNCPVTSYLQRTVMQPVQSQQLMSYYEPQTTCCQTTIGAPVATLPAGAVPVGAVAQPPVAPVPVAPQGGEQRQPAVPNGGELREGAPVGGESYRYPAPPSPVMPRASEGATFRPAPTVPAPSSTPPSVRIDRIVSVPGAPLRGEVVRGDQQPDAGAKVLFVSADKTNVRERVTADAAGQFKVQLGTGNWLIYVEGSNGRTEYRSKVDVRADAPAVVRVVSR